MGLTHSSPKLCSGDQVTVSELLRIADHLESPDREIVKRAYERAASAHKGQRRLSGEEYVNHPMEVAAILADLELDAATIAAAPKPRVAQPSSVNWPPAVALKGPPRLTKSAANATGAGT